MACRCAPATRSIGGDELAFAYENGPGKTRLAVFGVEDANRRVYWYYPAWTQPDEDPVAIPVETDGRRHELPDAVRQVFDGPLLEIHALFLDAPLSVRRIEALFEEHPAGPLPIPGAVESVTTLSVTP